MTARNKWMNKYIDELKTTYPTPMPTTRIKN